MSLLLHGDCLEHLKSIDNDSVDFIFCDLPYGQTNCAWDIIIPWEPFWKEIMRVKKLHTPMFFTTTTKFGVQLINSAPKKLKFFDLVWVKSASTGFLLSKKFPLRKHEMVYGFYEKLPFYDLSSHEHKFKKEVKPNPNRDNKSVCYGEGKNSRGVKYTEEYREKHGKKEYDPPLPTTIVKEEDKYSNGSINSNTYDIPNKSKGGMYRSPAGQYDPPLPTTIVKEELCKYDVNKNTYGGGKEGRIKISKDKKDHQQKYDPPLPVSVIKEDIMNSELYGELPKTENFGKSIGMTSNQSQGQPRYDPPLPTTMLEIKSTRGKHSTEKPVALMEWLLKYYSKEGDTVLDPTMGSGSTGVACRNMKRNFIGIEKDPEIYEVAVNRIEE